MARSNIELDILFGIYNGIKARPFPTFTDDYTFAYFVRVYEERGYEYTRMLLEHSSEHYWWQNDMLDREDKRSSKRSFGGIFRKLVGLS